MGALREQSTGVEHWLGPRHEVGRGPNNHLQLDNRRASNSHAELIWDGAGWRVRDLGSTNGTYVGETLVRAGEDHPLEPGATLSFGDRACAFRLVDASAPTLSATGDSGRVRRLVDGLLALPDESCPEVTIFLGDDGVWMAELPDETRTVAHGEVLEAGERWTLFVPTHVPRTRRVDGPSSCLEMELHFIVSRDQEHIELEMRAAHAEIRPKPRAHTALLLQLARIRLDDAAAGIAAPDCGWVHREDLCKMLGIGPDNLSLWVFRARRQVAAQGLLDAASFIERRPGASQLRLGPPAVSIHQS